MEMILLGTYDTNNKEEIILYSKREGKCKFFKKPKDFDEFLYSYFNEIEMAIDKHDEIINMENLGPCDINSLLENLRFASNNLKILNTPKENNIIIYLEDINEVVRSNGKYVLNFNYLGENYAFNISDETIISYLNESGDNLYILNKYMKNSKIILIIIKDNMKDISIIRIHSIKMGLKL